MIASCGDEVILPCWAVRRGITDCLLFMCYLVEVRFPICCDLCGGWMRLVAILCSCFL